MTRALTLTEAATLTAGATMWTSVAIADADIPSFSMADGPMGIASGRIDEREVSLLSPCPTALGASWNVALVAEVGRMIGGDAVARDVDAVLAPNVNLARSPLAGRAFEYFSEDPLLAGVLGAAWITGLQSTGTGSVAKHLVCNDSETGRDFVDVRVDERTLREVYLLPFELAAAAGCVGMLAAYNRVNGDWCSEQAHVITRIVKDEWRFPYLVMSDWFGTHSTEGTITSGLDLEMPGPARFMGPKIAEAVTAGRVDPARVRDAAARVAATARRVTGPKTPPAPEEAADILEQAAAEGFVLLRNQGDLLPLAPGVVKRIAVIGPNAAAPCYQGGTFAKISVSPDTPTPVAAIRARYGADCEIVFEPGVDPQPRLPAMPVAPGRDIGDGCVSGMTLDYFDSTDCSGTPRFSETRATNSLVWFVGVHDQGRFDQPGSVRASGLFRAETDGAHRFYLGATGLARLLIDGREVLRGGRELPAKDVMGALKSGDADSVEVMLSAGQEVRVTVEFGYTPARVHGLWYGLRAPDSPAAMLARAVAAARDADAVFLIVGETSDSSVESKDRPDTRLAPEQLALIEAVAAANPRTAAIVNVGHAFDAEWGDQVAALMVAWYPGQGFAPALASVLSGDREPGGRMPVSIARAESEYCGYALTPDADGRLAYDEGTRFGYRGLIANGTPARHALGSGFGYARFDWSDVRIEDGAVSVLVRNVSARAGAEVVQVYRDAPECALLGFAKVSLAPAEQRRVEIAVEPRLLRLWAEDGWAEITGEIALRVARDAEDAGLVVTLSR
ncbi:beta-glucosidase [Sphingomonas panacis]|uniref:Beta-glucosidase n=1 Tax=Sphingomonas panacis TaxID=1560345 RepID=A0A1B3ZBF7_9SPHN|nr:glycoside hydrolase family 3 C-terminal domain-containing protein [Sphingomonas panacis]AOH84763.1 beta-glucosidase [Sphingomonas panacis]